MIISQTPQGTTEWLNERAGKPTSSSFDQIVTTKGVPSKSAQKYMFTLAAERITGVKMDTYQSEAMQRGVAMEAEARELYTLITGNEVKEVGVCFPNEAMLYGASPDGLIGDDGVLEIKCPLPHTHVGYLLNGKLPSAYYTQVQGQLLVTDREYVDFVSYFPGLRPLIIRVLPDKGFQGALRGHLENFCAELDKVTERLRDAA